MNQTTVPMGEQESKYITKLARKQLSRIGFVYLAGTVLLLALELSLVRLFRIALCAVKGLSGPRRPNRFFQYTMPQ